MRQASGKEVMQMVDSPDGPLDRIEVPEVRTAQTGAMWDLSRAEVLIDAKDFRIMEFSARGTFLERPTACRIGCSPARSSESVQPEVFTSLGAGRDRHHRRTARRAPRRTLSSPRSASWRARKAFGDSRPSAPTVHEVLRTCRRDRGSLVPGRARGRLTAFSARMAQERPPRSGCCWISCDRRGERPQSWELIATGRALRRASWSAISRQSSPSTLT